MGTVYYRPSGYHERTEATSPCESERCPYCLEVFWPDLHDHPEDFAPFCGAQCKREWERELDPFVDPWKGITDEDDQNDGGGVS